MYFIASIQLLFLKTYIQNNPIWTFYRKISELSKSNWYWQTINSRLHWLVPTQGTWLFGCATSTRSCMLDGSVECLRAGRDTESNALRFTGRMLRANGPSRGMELHPQDLNAGPQLSAGDFHERAEQSWKKAKRIRNLLCIVNVFIPKERHFVIWGTYPAC